MKNRISTAEPTNWESSQQKVEAVLAKTLEDNTVYNENLTEKYQHEWRLGNPHQFMAYTTWLEEIGDIQGKEVLDLASGAGDSSRMLAEQGAKVVGVEISEHMFNNAKSQDNVSYILADASIPKQYWERPFDKVVAAFFLNYASSLEKLEGMLKNVALNLQPNEQFVTITISPEHPIVESGKHISHSTQRKGEPFVDWAEIHATLRTKEGEKICDFDSYYRTKQTYEKLLQENGFRDIQWIELRMYDEWKKLENWEDIEKKNMLVIIKATKDTI